MRQQYSLEPANYADYRDFLKIRFENLKHTHNSFSLNFLAKKSGVSKSLLQFVFKKQRHLGLDRLPTIARTLKLNSEEEYYLYLMVCHDSSKSREIRTHFDQILNRIRHEHVAIGLIETQRSNSNDKKLHLDHMNMILQAVVRLDGFKEDPGWIKENLMLDGIQEQTIVSYLAELERDGYIFRNEKGVLEAKSETLWRPDPLDPSGQSVYSAGARSLAQLMKTPKIYCPAVYSSMSLAVDEENLNLAEKYMIEVHHRLCSLAAASKKPTAVMYVGNYLLTLVRLKQ